jgi:CMP-2-keto-3-deoxyoctulosonic acid synthetase
MEFNDDFRFQFSKYTPYQNIFFDYDEFSIGDIIIKSEIYEYSQPFLIKNIKNKHPRENNFLEIFELVNDESFIDVSLYEKALCEYEKDKKKEIIEFEKNPKNKSKIDTINRILEKRPSNLVYKHMGIYGYTKEALLNFVSFEKSEREKQRSLEQMRALDNGMRIKTVVTEFDSISIDTEEDYIAAKRKFT